MKYLPLIALLAAFAGSTFAQERNAGQANDAQMNWSTLSNQINMVNTQNKALAATIAKFQACANQGMLYAPGTSGANAQGCKSLSSTLGTDSSKEAIVVSPKGDGWGTKYCPDGYVMVGGYWTKSDTWAMRCRPVVIK